MFRVILLLFVLCNYSYAGVLISGQAPSGGVPIEFSQHTASGDQFVIKKGQLNKLRLRPQIINEHVESSRNIIATVTSSNIVGQIFRASHDNINGIDMTLGSSESVLFDNFETYADSAALQVVWVETGTVASLDTSIVSDLLSSTKSMRIPLGSLNDTWTKTISATDFTGYNGVFDFYQTAEFSRAKVSIVLGDGTNSKSLELAIQDKEIWTHFDIPEEALVEDGGGTTDMTAITKVSFRVDDKELGGFAYVDNYYATPAPGSVELKLWNMGSTKPSDSITAISDGTQYLKIGDVGISGLQEASLELDLIGGNRQYHVDGFVAGVALEIPTNEILIPDNYYIITINYIDTGVDVYGPNSAWDDYYESGYSFTAPDESTAITATGSQEDIQFAVFSTQDVYIDKFVQIMDSAPGSNSKMFINIEDYNMAITGIVMSGIPGVINIDRDLPATYYMPKGSKFEQNYNDDFTDSVGNISLLFRYYFKPNGDNIKE